MWTIGNILYVKKKLFFNSHLKKKFYIVSLTTQVYTKEKESDEATWPFDMPENIILNTAIGGNWGGSQGVDNSSFPLK
jgi:hypothetical protein